MTKKKTDIDDSAGVDVVEREEAPPQQVVVSVSPHVINGVYRVVQGEKLSADTESRFVHHEDWKREERFGVVIPQAEWDAMLHMNDLSDWILADLPAIVAQIQRKHHVLSADMVTPSFMNAVASHLAMMIKRKVNR